MSALFFWIQSFQTAPIQQKRTDYIAPPQIIKSMSVGLAPQLSDIFWIRAIQDFDHCEQKINQNECKGQSWLFKILDLVVELDTYFLEAHFYGGLALTVLVLDYEGATKIFDKGAERFPKNWELNYVAGYHAMIEEKDYKKASLRYLSAAQNGAPDWVHILAGRMAVDGGDSDLALKVLDYMMQNSTNTKYIDRLKEKIKQGASTK